MVREFPRVSSVIPGCKRIRRVFAVKLRAGSRRVVAAPRQEERRCGNCVKASRRISITPDSSLVVGKSSRHYVFALEYNRFGGFTLAKSPPEARLGLSLRLPLSFSLLLGLSLNSRELSPPPRLLIFADNYRTGDPFNSASPRPRHVREIDSKRPCSLFLPPVLPSLTNFVFSQLSPVTSTIFKSDSIRVIFRGCENT